MTSRDPPARPPESRSASRPPCAVSPGRSLSAPPAVAAEPDEIQHPVVDLVTARPEPLLCRERRRRTLEIEQQAAGFADEVVVIGKVAVEARPPAAGPDPEFSFRDQKLQIPIDGPQRDPRETTADLVVNTLGGGMDPGRPHGLADHAPLERLPPDDSADDRGLPVDSRSPSRIPAAGTPPSSDRPHGAREAAAHPVAARQYARRPPGSQKIIITNIDNGASGR